MEKIFDTHAHYDSHKFDSDRDELLASMPDRGIAYILNPGCELDSSRTAIALAERHPFVYAAVGVHPEDCQDWEDSHVDILRALADHPKVKAIGEIGLDYYWKENPPRELQQHVLRAQMALAEELDLPVIIHDREAHADSMAIVRDFPHVRGVFHCYSGAVEQAKELMDLGWMISFTGSITYKNARRALEVIAALPMDRMMLETDAPYMTPVPHRGRRNDSSYIPFMAEKMAEIKSLPVEDVIRQTRENGLRFFRIPE
ncbi:MAG: TatD family hydrolase [Oscillospiraceae bacterium]|nr:TatD family hydrolase [Oscillospiraceae bacterium]